MGISAGKGRDRDMSGTTGTGGEPGADLEGKARIARQFIAAIPFSGALGMQLEDIGDGLAVISMPWNAALVGDPKTGVIHGGAVSALMDTCGGAAVMCHAQALAGTATIDLSIDYMRAATPGQRITARAQCYHVTRSVAFVRARGLRRGPHPPRSPPPPAPLPSPERPAERPKP